jgi:hypothetical protein
VATDAAEGTVRSPRWYESFADVNGDEQVHSKLYAYVQEGDLFVGTTKSVMFTVDAPARDVWPVLKDSNLWQAEYGHHYSGVIGDLEGKSFRLGDKPNPEGPHQYHVLRVIPEHLMVVNQPGDWDGGPDPWDGFHVFMLNEHDGKSTVTIIMQHALRSTDQTEEEAIARWQESQPENQRKWRDVFIPKFKELVYEKEAS